MASVRYRITPDNPRAHRFVIETTIENPDPAGQTFSMPVWIPGSYLVREFARHVMELSATASGSAVHIEKVDKQTWRAAPLSGSQSGPLVLKASVYAWDLSVRAAHLDQSHGFFNGTSVFFSIDGKEGEPCDVVIDPPSDPTCKGWRVATTLSAVDVRDVGFGTYRAQSYDELIDHPVEMGTYAVVDWASEGVPHQMAITGRIRLDKERLKKDCTAICAEHIKLFHGAPHGDTSVPAPMKRYLFLTMAVGDGYGGLEHRDSTALICKRDDLPKPGMTEPSEGYRSFLGLVSHEYFHLWNVKRIKPAAFTPYRLNEEGYTRLLWAFEGITSYYDDLALVRAGVIDVDSYLDLLGKTLTRVLRGAGRLKQSVAESSFDAWIKFYRPDENTPNAVVSYYTKGSLVALSLDLTIREATQDQRSLDDVMRALWMRHGKTGVGVAEDGVEAIASELAGVDLTPFFDAYVRGTEDPPLTQQLARYGLALHLRAAEGDADTGGKAGKNGGKKKTEDAKERASLGATLGGGESGATLTTVQEGGAAQEAGLSAGDVVIALDGLKTTKASLARMIAERAPGTTVRIHAFRRDELLELDVKLKAPADDTAWIEVIASAPAAAVELRKKWLGA
jgi:predicted metalloprotease with PDZ domain